MLAEIAAPDCSLPGDFTVRAATMDDLRAAVELFNACGIAMVGTPEYTIDELRSLWQNPHFDMAASTKVVVGPADALAGFMAV